MGYKSVNGKCLLTSLPAEDIAFQNSNWKGYEYKIKINNKDYIILLPENTDYWFSDDFFKKNRHIIAGLILNENWTTRDTIIIEDIEVLKKTKNIKDFPETPKQKRDFIFLKIFQSISFAGDKSKIYLRKYDYTPFEYYTINHKELQFFLSSLAEIGYINITKTLEYWDITVTFEGLNYGILLQEEGELSNNCFIAMAFNSNTIGIRKVIKDAVIETGFTPILIDERQIDSDKTINDEIIANIKKCFFCIADYSYHSNGVYFESGFALGQGKKVIYTCNEAEFKNAHFDIKPLQHIIYKNEPQLKKDLINKIKVWIK